MSSGSFIFEEFIGGKFGALPKWARVVTYFIILLLYVYLYLTPAFIWGECLIKNNDGSVTPFRGGVVSCVIDGHTLKGQINEEGVWSVPVVSKLPSKIEVYFNYEGKQYPLTFSTSVWSKSTHKVFFKENPAGFTIALSEPSFRLRQAGLFFDKLIRSIGPTEAMAQTKIARKAKVPAPQPPLLKDELAERVHASVAQILGVDAAQINPETLLRRTLDAKQSSNRINVSQVKRIRLVTNLQRVFNVKITDEEWDTINTVADATQLIRQKVNRR
jgi:hypothetical protein